MSSWISFLHSSLNYICNCAILYYMLNFIIMAQGFWRIQKVLNVVKVNAYSRQPLGFIRLAKNSKKMLNANNTMQIIIYSCIVIKTIRLTLEFFVFLKCQIQVHLQINVICVGQNLCFVWWERMKPSSVDLYTTKRPVPWITYKAFWRFQWWLQEIGAETKCKMEPIRYARTLKIRFASAI